jgi:hypothetical protein
MACVALPLSAFAQAGPGVVTDLTDLATVGAALLAKDWPKALAAGFALLCTVIVSAGMLAKVKAWLVAHLSVPIKLGTQTSMLSKIGTAIADACEDIVKAEISGPMLDNCVAAVSSGGGVKALATVLQTELPRLIQATAMHIGPLAANLLESILGTNAANSKVAAALLAAVHDLCDAKLAAGYVVGTKTNAPPAPVEAPKVTETAPSGRPIVTNAANPNPGADAADPKPASAPAAKADAQTVVPLPTRPKA